MFKVKTCQIFSLSNFSLLQMIWQFSVILCSDYILIYPSSAKKSCAKMKTWSIVHHRQLQSAFSAAMSLVQRWGWAGDRPGIDEGGNCKRAKLSFAAGDQTEQFFWMIFLNSFLIFFFFSKNNSIRLDCYLWEEQLASTGLRSITL